MQKKYNLSTYKHVLECTYNAKLIYIHPPRTKIVFTQSKAASKILSKYITLFI